MKKWQNNYFSGNILDSEKKTGAGTLNLKKIAAAFDLKYFLIKNPKTIEKSIKKILSIKGPCLIEVVTNPNQPVFGTDF